MRRIVCLLIAVAGCHDNTTSPAPDLSMVVDTDMGPDAAGCANGAACAANPADLCCGNVCVGGTCCSNSDCGDGGLSCVNHTCTTCPSAVGNLLAVDPAQTPGAPPTGADVDGCRFPRITAALAT